MTDDIKPIWQDPPAKANKTDKYVPLRVALRSRPGDWAVLPVPYSTASQATNIKKNWPDGPWEATSRLRSDGRYDIYVRYTGEAQ